MAEDLHCEWARDSHFAELKDAEILRERLDLLGSIGDATEQGFYSKDWIRKNVLRQSDEEIKQIDKEVKEDQKETEEAEEEEETEDSVDENYKIVQRYQAFTVEKNKYR